MESLFDPKPQAKAFLNVNRTFACGFGSNDQPCQDLQTRPLSSHQTDYTRDTAQATASPDSGVRFSPHVSRRVDSAGFPTFSCGVYEDRAGSVESGLLLRDALPRYPSLFLPMALCRFDSPTPACDLSTES